MATVENFDPSNPPMKWVLIQGFKEMSNKGLSLNLIKRKALVDFLACIQEVLTKAAIRSNIVHGFVASGLVGDESKFTITFQPTSLFITSKCTWQAYHTEATVVSVSPKQFEFSNEVIGSTFLDNEQWLMEVLKTLDSEKHCHVEPMNTPRNREMINYKHS
jgi:hypothetical protein